MAPAARVQPSSIGQVPPIEDRGLREYLKRLQAQTEKLKPAADAATSASQIALSRIREQISGLQGQIDDLAGSNGFQGVAGIQDDFVITADDLAAKRVTLTAAPADSTKVELSIYGGIEQRPGVDFIVEGQFLSWDGLALELLLEVGSTFSVRY